MFEIENRTRDIMVWGNNRGLALRSWTGYFGLLLKSVDGRTVTEGSATEGSRDRWTTHEIEQD